MTNSVESKYIKIEFIEDLTVSGLEEKPLGVRYVQFYGCALEDTLGVCGTHFTRVSTNDTAYRHIGFVTHLLKIFSTFYVDMITTRKFSIFVIFFQKQMKCNVINTLWTQIRHEYYK